MKRFVYIQGMSLSQDDIIHKMKGRRIKLAEHLAKCVMYGDSLGLNKYNHWVEHEIATWISEINDLTSKPKGKKLKPSKYADYLFGLLGNDRSDSRSALIDLQVYNSTKTHPYPEVEITDDMVDRMFEVTETMLGKIVPILSSRNNFTKNDFENLLHSLLDPICIRH